MKGSTGRGILLAALVFCVAIGFSLEGFTQKLFMYPAKGQNTEQQSRDRYELSYSPFVGQVVW